MSQWILGLGFGMCVLFWLLVIVIGIVCLLGIIIQNDPELNIGRVFFSRL